MKFKKNHIRYFLTLILFLFSSAIYAQFGPQPAPEITADTEIINENNSTLAAIRVFYRFPENFHQTLNKDFFKAEIISPENTSYETEYPEGKEEKGEINYYGSAEIIMTVNTEDLTPGKQILKLKASYQLCDEDGTCYFPGSEEIDVSLTLPENRIISDNNFSETTGTLNKPGTLSGVLKYMILAFIGGLLLNIMPCVFPLLSIKALSLVKQSEHDKREILISSLFYSAGIILSLIILALFLILIKNAGQFAGWGFQMQNKWFVLFLISAIYLFALSMFDVFTITLPGVNTAGKLSGKGGYPGHFLTGIFAVLVAAPCTAPFLGSAIAFSLSGSSMLILLLFIFIGTGFAFPFLLLGFYPALVKKLPKPGKWSVYFKEILGFILAGTAFYLLISFAKGKPSSVVSSIIIFLFILTFLAWLYGKIALSGIRRKYSFTALLLLLLLSVAAAVSVPDFDYEGVNISADKKTDMQFSAENLAKHLDEGRSVFVDIYADWCTTCKINERLVLNTDEIKELFAENNTVLLKGDFTDQDPHISEWMKENSKAGVPVYAFYRDDKTPPVFLPEIITRKKIRDLYSGN